MIQWLEAQERTQQRLEVGSKRIDLDALLLIIGCHESRDIILSTSCFATVFDCSDDDDDDGDDDVSYKVNSLFSENIIKLKLLLFRFVVDFYNSPQQISNNKQVKFELKTTD